MAINKNTIKAEVKRQNPGVDVVSIDHKSFGIFVVKVKKEMPRSTKIGLIIGETDFDKAENGVILSKIDWM